MKIKEVAAWLAALMGSIVTIIQAYPVIAQAAKTTIDVAFYSKPENVAVFVSDNQPLANQYLQILAERGFATRFMPIAEVGKIEESDISGILLVHSDGNLDKGNIAVGDALWERLGTHTKIIGIGTGGADFIGKLDRESMLGGVAHSSLTTAMLDDPVKPKEIGQGLPTGEIIKVYKEGSGSRLSAVGAYDDGSTAMQMAQGIARMSNGQARDPCGGAHWTVVVHGNFALWGYELPAAQLTKEGRQLFGDLAQHMLQSPYVRVDARFPQVEPGAIEGQLGCGLPGQVYRFRPTGAGLIKVRVSADAPVAVTLNAPFQAGFLARDDDTSAQVQFDVQPDHLARSGGNWNVRVNYFGSIQPGANVHYRLELDYPYSKDRSIIWLVAAMIASAIGVLAIIRLAMISWRTIAVRGQANQNAA